MEIVACIIFVLLVVLVAVGIFNKKADNAKETAKLLPSEPEEEEEPTILHVWYEGASVPYIYENVDHWDMEGGRWLVIYTGGDDQDNRIYIDTHHKGFLRFHVLNN
jgi:hypothetical protein